MKKVQHLKAIAPLAMSPAQAGVQGLMRRCGWSSGPPPARGTRWREPRRLPASSGFSLIEMLVVLAIAAMAGSVIVLAAPSGAPSLAGEADALASRLLAARDLALIENRMVRVELAQDGYRQTIRSRSGWTLPADGPAFTPWRDGTSIAVADRPLPVSVSFDPIGLSEPAAIRMLRGATAECVRVDGGGNVRREAANGAC